MDKTQKEKLEKEWIEFVEASLWQGEDEYTKNMAVGNVSDWWLEQFDLAIKETEERMVREIEEVTDDFGNGEAYSKFPAKDIVVLIKNRITNLLRNK